MLKVETRNEKLNDVLYRILLVPHLTAYAYHDPEKYPKFEDILPKNQITKKPHSESIDKNEIRQEIINMEP